MSSTVDDIANLLEAQKRLCVRLAATCRADDWTLALLEIIIGESPPGWRPHVWRYNSAAFIAARPTGAAVARWLTRRKIRLASLVIPLELHREATVERRDSNSQGTFQTLPWPTRNWNLHPAGNAVQHSHEELVAANAPAFISFDQAAATHFDPPRRMNRNFSGREAIVRCQDERARFEDVLLRPTEVIASVSGKQLRSCSITVGGYDGPHRALTSRAKRVRLPLAGALPPGAWLALHRDSELIDRRILDPAWGATGVDVEVAATTSVEVLINGGERDTVEFKSRIPASPQKVMKTVSAFANGVGGVLLFGVEDDGQITGVPPREARRQADRLSNLIRDTVTPLPDYRAETVRLDRHVIIAVTVEPGHEPPYGVGGEGRNARYFIRRGATTFPARPADVRAVVRAREPQPALTFPRGA